MELAVWPDFEDRLQTTTFISCAAVSDAKDDIQVTTLLMMPLRQKREDCPHEKGLHSGMVCIIQNTYMSFVVVQATKGELKS